MCLNTCTGGVPRWDDLKKVYARVLDQRPSADPNAKNPNATVVDSAEDAAHATKRMMIAVRTYSRNREKVFAPALKKLADNPAAAQTLNELVDMIDTNTPLSATKSLKCSETIGSSPVMRKPKTLKPSKSLGSQSDWGSIGGLDSVKSDDSNWGHIDCSPQVPNPTTSTIHRLL